MPQTLAFHEPTSVEQAALLLAEYRGDAKVVAGATALTILLRNRLIAPRALISLGRIGNGLRTIREDDGALVLGALVTHREVEQSALVRNRIPVLAETFATVANVRIRNVATVGGVVAEADYASDPPAVLLALDAEIEARGRGGTRAAAPLPRDGGTRPGHDAPRRRRADDRGRLRERHGRARRHARLVLVPQDDHRGLGPSRDRTRRGPDRMTSVGVKPFSGMI